MDLLEAVNRLYYDITLNELRLMNDNTLYPNMSYNSLLYLDLISGRENCTVSSLAEALHISKPAVTSKVNELIRQGLVQKTRSEQDHRVHYLAVTPAVAADYRQYDKRLVHALGLVQERYAPHQIATLCDMLELIRLGYLEDPT